MVVVFCACGQRIEVDAQAAGDTVRCDRCGASVALPPDSLAASAVGQGDSPAPGALPEDRSPRSVTEGHPPISPAEPAAVPHSAPHDVLRPHPRDNSVRVSVLHDERLGREVARQELTGQAADDPASRQRFIDEAKITGQLQHPGIVPVYALGTDAAGRSYYTTKLV
ncbi:MAG: hypothetical protein FJ276_30055, partial [Planctomycetes bacterium]|nr:hypothetical protein [Planctomycetota bacterium]